MSKKNLITIESKFGTPIEIDLDDLEVTSDYEAALFYPPKLEARRRYTDNEEDDVHNEFYGDAISTLLDVIRDLNKRVQELEKRLDRPNSKQD